MNDPIDNPEHAAAIDAELMKLDRAELAEKSNALTGGCLRGEEALIVARLTALAAIRQPGKAVCVAGLHAEFNGGHLSLGLATHIIDIEIPNGKEF